MIPILRFGENPAREHMVVGWTGRWPPPPRLVMAVGVLQEAIFEPDQLTPQVQAGLDQFGTRVFTYERVSYSTLDADVDTHPHLARGAEYEVVPC